MLQRPILGNANAAELVVCSDQFICMQGTATKATSSLYFSGHNCVASVISDIRSELQQVHTIIVAGAGNGGIGALNHLDWIATMFPASRVRGLSLGSWTIPFDDYERIGVDSILLSWEVGSKLWGRAANVHVGEPSTFVDESCWAAKRTSAELKTGSTSADCLWLPRLLPFVATPSFHAANLFDTAQLVLQHHMPADTYNPSVREYVGRFGYAMAESTTNLSLSRSTALDMGAVGLFFLSCFAHDQFDSSFGSVDTQVLSSSGNGT